MIKLINWEISAWKEKVSVSADILFIFYNKVSKEKKELKKKDSLAPFLIYINLEKKRRTWNLTKKKFLQVTQFFLASSILFL